MIAKCLEAELFTAPQDIRIEMMRSVNGASKSSSSSLTKLLVSWSPSGVGSFLIITSGLCQDLLVS